MISKHRKCLRTPWRPSINTTLYCVSGALIQTYQPHVNTEKYTDSIRGNLHTHIYAKCKSSTLIITKKWFVLCKISSMGEWCLFCNMYTHISYVIQYTSTFILSKQKTDSTFNEPTCRCSQRWPNMCRFCTFKQGQRAHIQKEHLKLTNACCPLLESLRSNLKCWIYEKRTEETLLTAVCL